MKAYVHLIGSRPVHPSFNWLWKAATQKKHKIFFWLLLKDRLGTQNIWRRKSQALPSYDCILCTFEHEETVEHLFSHYPFAHACWSIFNLQIIQADPFQILTSMRAQLNVSFFMDIIIILSWTI
jgi:hypothetical protein